MNKLAALVVLGCLAITIDAQTKTRQCRGFRQLKTDEVSVSNCQGGVCKLKRNSDVTITLKFTPDRDIKNPVTHVTALIGTFSFPFVGVDNVSACDNLFDESGKKTSCQLQKGKTYIYKNSFRVLEIYPKIQLVVHWAIQTGGKDITCFEVPARIV